ncbi:hypothetical protein [Thalassospira sp. MCCC 1A01428]|uniref:hypothetical protein n=1 Tax=Thalassospira sp. MCCC 1A01428 TaxID=1470575 RepID=UPI001FEF6419|nr:hypothetical protein [Thalassospira sp. MCCC 1A01428]
MSDKFGHVMLWGAMGQGTSWQDGPGHDLELAQDATMVLIAQKPGKSKNMRELRCIIFENVEIIRAITGHRRRTGKPLPPGQLGKLKISTSPEIVVTLELLPDDGHSLFIPSSGAELAAALIAYCIDLRVPMPASAQKALTVLDGHIALKITKV